MTSLESTPPGIHKLTWTPSATQIRDLRARLQAATFPSSEPVHDWSQGVPTATLTALASYWATRYDMSRVGAYLSSQPHFRTTVDGVSLHFAHVRSLHADARPLLLLHGWPGSVLEFRHVVSPLVNPALRPDGSRFPAFHLVVPSLPGFGLSGEPAVAGWGFERCAKAMEELMRRLGYADGEAGYLAQGGDFGADIVAEMGRRASKGLRGVHMNTAFFDYQVEAGRTRAEGRELEPAEERAVTLGKIWRGSEDAYFRQQATKPQTLAFGLADSPVGLLAWLYEKIVVWSAYRSIDLGEGASDLMPPLDRDEILDNISLYWFTNSIASSMRMYWEVKDDNTAVNIPESVAVGVSLFPRDPSYAVREWGERYYKRIVRWHDVEKGGHYGAWEQPDLFVREVREWAAAI